MAPSGLFVEPVESLESDPLLESLLSSVRPQNSKQWIRKQSVSASKSIAQETEMIPVGFSIQTYPVVACGSSHRCASQFSLGFLS